MAKDARSALQTLTTSTASANSTAAALNTTTGSPVFGYRVNMRITSMLLTTTGTVASTITPTLYRSNDSSTWIAFHQANAVTLQTTAQSFTMDPLISLEPTSPYLAAGFVASLGAGGSGGLSVIWDAYLVTGKEDRA